MISYYEILGVPRHATPDDLRRAHREHATAFHPDLNGNSKAANHKFKEIQEAYEVLSDPVRRRAYDQKIDSLNRPRSQSNPPPPSPPPPPPPHRGPPPSPTFSHSPSPKRHTPSLRKTNGVWPLVRGFVAVMGACLLVSSVFGFVILLLVGLSGRRNLRPMNFCGFCGHSWYPRGHNISTACPRCRSTNVNNWTNSLFSSFGDWNTWSGVCEVFGWLATAGIAVVFVSIMVIATTGPEITTRPDRVSGSIAFHERSENVIRVPRAVDPRRTFPDVPKDNLGEVPDDESHIPSAPPQMQLFPHPAIEVEKFPRNLDEPPPETTGIGSTEKPLQSGIAGTEINSYAKPLDRQAELINTLKASVNPSDRLAAVNEIGKLQVKGIDLVPNLAEALNDTSPDVRRAAARVLGGIGAEAKPAIPALSRRVREEKEDIVRGESAAAMIKIDPLSSQVKDCLTMTLVGGDGTTIRKLHGGVITANRIWACEQLITLGERAAWAEDMLRELLIQLGLHLDTDRNADLFEKTAQALIAVKSNDLTTLGVARRLRDGKGLVSKSPEKLTRAKIAADSCAKAIENVRE